MIKKITTIVIISSISLITGCFNKKINCEFNGLNLNSNLIGLDRSKVIKTLGEPSHSDLSIKLFEDYSYKFANKRYSVIVKYENRGDYYYVSNVQCLKSNPKFEIFNHVIWH
ncbi:hypothetical protein [Psychrobacter phenylpyruvicus]|uniref:Lipoprotein SmpA/OmlA domain-containing protein n=1 Tax=Psychrobacter phenylpyruvicus TaxID=29432 RepID=A0A379LNU7_9GAMM|nr:hypothetical protein [Psychrobacter phenylpyruvicus]SUD91444.1 Uncharacterised protein [Psychrobacter phenylpyruvicus]